MDQIGKRGFFVTVIGLGLMLSWVNQLFSNFAVGHLSSTSFLPVTEFPYALVTFSSGIVYIALIVSKPSGRDSETAIKPALALNATIVMTLSSLLMSVFPLSPMPLIVVGSILGGLGWAALGLAWNELLVKSSQNESALAITLGITLGFLSSTVLISFPTISSLLAIAYPTVIYSMLRQASTDLAKKPIKTGDESSTVLANDGKEASRLIARMAIFSFLVCFAYKLVTIPYLPIAPGESLQMTSYGIGVTSILIGAGMIICVLASSKRDGRYPTFWYRIAFFALTLSAVLSIAETNAIDTELVALGAYQIVRMFIWISAVAIGISSAPHARVAYCACLAGLSIGLSLGMFAEPCFLALSSRHGEADFYFSFIGIAILMIAFIFVFSEQHALLIQRKYFCERKLSFREKCDIVAKRYHLSPRESEVLSLLATGRSASYIQDSLCLSKSTVATHREHVYQKTGVHSKQGLIDLVETAGEK